MAAAKAIFLQGRCTASNWPAPSAVKKLQSCPLSRIRPDWTNCFAGTATETENSHSDKIKIRLFGGF